MRRFWRLWDFLVFYVKVVLGFLDDSLSSLVSWRRPRSSGLLDCYPRCSPVKSVHYFNVPLVTAFTRSVSGSPEEYKKIRFTVRCWFNSGYMRFLEEFHTFLRGKTLTHFFKKHEQICRNKIDRQNKEHENKSQKQTQNKTPKQIQNKKHEGNRKGTNKNMKKTKKNEKQNDEHKITKSKNHEQKKHETKRFMFSLLRCVFFSFWGFLSLPF